MKGWKRYGSVGERKLSSYFGRVKYDFDEKYLLTATVRQDGTSRLANNNRGTFPAFSIGWRADKEDFFNFGKEFSSMMIRVSWGQTGNQQVPPYSTVDSTATILIIVTMLLLVDKIQYLLVL